MNRVLGVPRRIATASVLVVGGGALTVATWLSGEHGFAVALGVFYIVASLVVYLVAGGSSDVAAIIRVDGDERQRTMDAKATQFAAYAMATVAFVATVVLMARGEDPGGFLWTCSVGGAAYAVALGVQRHRT